MAASSQIHQAVDPTDRTGGLSNCISRTFRHVEEPDWSVDGQPIIHWFFKRPSKTWIINHICLKIHVKQRAQQI